MELVNYNSYIIYMAGKMAKNLSFIVFNYFVSKGFLRSINCVCFDEFAVKRIIEFKRATLKTTKARDELVSRRTT